MYLLLIHVHDVHGRGHVRDCVHVLHGHDIRILGLSMYLLLIHVHDVHGRGHDDHGHGRDCVHGRGCGRGHDDHGHGRLHSQDNRRCLCQHLLHNRFLPYDQIRLSQYFFDNLLIIAYHNAFHLYNEYPHNLD